MTISNHSKRVKEQGQKERENQMKTSLLKTVVAASAALIVGGVALAESTELSQVSKDTKVYTAAQADAELAAKADAVKVAEVQVADCMIGTATNSDATITLFPSSLTVARGEWRNASYKLVGWITPVDFGDEGCVDRYSLEDWELYEIVNGAVSQTPIESINRQTIVPGLSKSITIGGFAFVRGTGVSRETYGVVYEDALAAVRTNLETRIVEATAGDYSDIKGQIQTNSGDIAYLNRLVGEIDTRTAAIQDGLDSKATSCVLTTNDCWIVRYADSTGNAKEYVAEPAGTSSGGRAWRIWSEGRGSRTIGAIAYNSDNDEWFVAIQNSHEDLERFMKPGLGPDATHIEVSTSSLYAVFDYKLVVTTNNVIYANSPEKADAVKVVTVDSPSLEDWKWLCAWNGVVLEGSSGESWRAADGDTGYALLTGHAFGKFGTMFLEWNTNTNQRTTYYLPIMPPSMKEGAPEGTAFLDECSMLVFDKLNDGTDAPQTRRLIKITGSQSTEYPVVYQDELSNTTSEITKNLSAKADIIKVSVVTNAAAWQVIGGPDIVALSRYSADSDFWNDTYFMRRINMWHANGPPTKLWVWDNDEYFFHLGYYDPSDHPYGTQGYIAEWFFGGNEYYNESPRSEASDELQFAGGVTAAWAVETSLVTNTVLYSGVTDALETNLDKVSADLSTLFSRLDGEKAEKYRFDVGDTWTDDATGEVYVRLPRIPVLRPNLVWTNENTHAYIEWRDNEFASLDSDGSWRFVLPWDEGSGLKPDLFTYQLGYLDDSHVTFYNAPEPSEATDIRSFTRSYPTTTNTVVYTDSLAATNDRVATNEQDIAELKRQTAEKAESVKRYNIQVETDLGWDWQWQSDPTILMQDHLRPEVLSGEQEEGLVSRWRGDTYGDNLVLSKYTDGEGYRWTLGMFGDTYTVTTESGSIESLSFETSNGQGPATLAYSKRIDVETVENPVVYSEDLSASLNSMYWACAATFLPRDYSEGDPVWRSERAGYVTLAKYESLLSQLVKAKSDIEKLKRRLDGPEVEVDISTNDNGIVTYSAPVNFSSNTNITRISVSFSVRGIPQKTSPAVLASRYAPRLLSEGSSEAEPLTIEITTLTVQWNGMEYECSLPEGMTTFTFKHELPPIPSSVHEHTPDGRNDCICSEYGITPEVPEEYLTPEDLRQSLIDTDNWVDLDNWPAEYTRTRGGNTYHYYPVFLYTGTGPDDGWEQVDIRIDELWTSDAWADGVLESMKDLEFHYKECAEAYISAHTCNDGSSHHSPGRSQTCGKYHWVPCVNPGANHLMSGTKGHDGHNPPDGRCGCGAEITPHEMEYSTKVAKAGNVGWTQSYYCKKGCGKSIPIDHTCVHTRCGKCSAGDDCDWPCPTCNGNHDFGGQTATRCVHCLCDGCGIAEHEQSGGTVIIDIAHHSGWSACNVADPDNILGHMDCCCQCGAYTCSSTNPGHSRKGKSPTYQPYEVDGEADKTQHVISDQTECERCKDPYGRLEPHQFDDPDYKWVSNEICAKRQICKHCDYEDIMDDTLSHSPDGDPLGASEDGDVCKVRYNCANCHEPFVKDESHKKVEGSCECANGCGHEFEHVWAEDACHNETCTNCHITKPGTSESHEGWSNLGASGHICACTRMIEPHSLKPVPGTGATTPGGWVMVFACEKCPYTEERGHLHLFVNCGTCQAGDGCTAVCTGCGGEHVFSKSGNSCAICVCPTSTNCTARSTEMEMHGGWQPCGYPDDPNDDGTANGAHCSCSCGAFGHPSSGTDAIENGHSYERTSGMSEYLDFDDDFHWHVLGECIRCTKRGKEKEGHKRGAEPYDYQNISTNTCRWLYRCFRYSNGDGCSHTFEEDHGHTPDGGVASIESYGSTLDIKMTYTCQKCGYSWCDDHYMGCPHCEILFDNGIPAGFGESYIRDCECSNCHTNWEHNFTIELPQENACSLWQCGNENCSVTTNRVAGTHTGWSDLDGLGNAEEGAELKGHQCLCGLKTEPHGTPEEVADENLECVKIKQCPDCQHKFEEIHTPELVKCGSNFFCAKCKRRRVASGDGYKWEEGGDDLHSWGGKPASERTKCVCDCGLVTSHYFAPSRDGCGCQCGTTYSHVAGTNPPCYCKGTGPSHSKILLKHGEMTVSTTNETHRCSTCSKSWVDTIHTFKCSVCNEEIGSSVSHGTHTCKGGYQQTAGELTYSWSSYTWHNPDTDEDEEIEAGSITQSWGGGGFSSAPPTGAGARAGSSVSASGATMYISQSGTYRLRAKCDDGGSVSIGGLSASGGASWSAWGAWVTGYLSEGEVGVSASADSVGGICGFEYQFELVQ